MPGMKRKFFGKSLPKGYAAKRRRMVAGVFPRRSRVSVAAVLRSQSKKGEVKATDGTNGAGSGQTLTLNATGQVVAMNLVSAGSSFFNRVGRKIEMKSIHLHGMIENITTANAQTDYVKILVVYDRQTNGALPSVSDILQNTDQQSNNTSTVFSDLNLNNRERFVILAEERIVLPATTAVPAASESGDSAQKTFTNVNRFVKLRGLNTHFKADSSPAVIGDISTGSLLLLTLGAYTAGTEAHQALLSWRLRFDDT